MSGFLVGLVLFCMSTYIGVILKKNYRIKVDFYFDYKEYLQHAKDMINYARTSVPEINAAFKAGKSKEFKELMNGRLPEKLRALRADEVTAVYGYLQSIGTTDVDTQLNSLALKLMDARKICETQIPSWEKQGKLYFKLSVLIGVGLLIIFI